jgi:cell division septation protein DedD
LNAALVIAAVFLGLALISAFILLRGRKKKREKEFRRLPRTLGTERRPERRLKPLLLWTLAILVLFWLILALSTFKAGEGETASAGASPAAARERPPATVVRGKFDLNPPPPTPQEQELLARIAFEAALAAEAEKAREEKELAEGPDPLAAAEAGLGFQPIPEELVIVGSPMTRGAREFAPTISRMEPLGRSLNPESPAPPKKPALVPGAPPPEKERPRLQAPPRAAELPPKPKPKPLSERRYTIIVGSFAKEANAGILKDKFSEAGLPAEIASVVVDNKTFFRVMSGLFDDKESAETYCRELKRKNLAERPYIMTL